MTAPSREPPPSPSGKKGRDSDQEVPFFALHASEPSAVRCEPRLVASLCDRGGRLKRSVRFKLTGVGVDWHDLLDPSYGPRNSPFAHRPDSTLPSG